MEILPVSLRQVMPGKSHRFDDFRVSAAPQDAGAADPHAATQSSMASQSVALFLGQPNCSLGGGDGAGWAETPARAETKTMKNSARHARPHSPRMTVQLPKLARAMATTVAQGLRARAWLVVVTARSKSGDQGDVAPTSAHPKKTACPLKKGALPVFLLRAARRPVHIHCAAQYLHPASVGAWECSWQ